MRWRIQQGPERLDEDLWMFTVVRGRRSKQVRARVGQAEAELRGDTQESLAADLVNRHLNDHVPPDLVSLAPGWSSERQEPAVAEMGFTNVRGFRMRWLDIAHRFNFPHWLQPRR